MKREFASATIIFNDGSAVYWRYLGKFERLYSKKKICHSGARGEWIEFARSLL